MVTDLERAFKVEKALRLESFEEVRARINEARIGTLFCEDGTMLHDATLFPSGEHDYEWDFGEGEGSVKAAPTDRFLADDALKILAE